MLGQTTEGTLLEIRTLADNWYQYVAMDHHKDYDCHFYIKFDIQYDGRLVIEVSHNGYIGDKFSVNAVSYDDAVQKLKQEMIRMIGKERVWVNRVLAEPHEYDEFQREAASTFMILFGDDLYGNQERS